MEKILKRKQKEIIQILPRKKMWSQVEPQKAIEKQPEIVQTRRKVWKPNIEKVNNAIINEGNFVQLNKFYHFYTGTNILELENAIIRHLILSNKKFTDSQG